MQEVEKGEQEAGEQPEKVASPSAEERGRAFQKGSSPSAKCYRAAW